MTAVPVLSRPQAPRQALSTVAMYHFQNYLEQFNCIHLNLYYFQKKKKKKIVDRVEQKVTTNIETRSRS